MNYSIEDIKNLAKGIYPKRCWASRPGALSATCNIDEGKYCGVDSRGKDYCSCWREVDIFTNEKLAQDILEALQSKEDDIKFLKTRIIRYLAENPIEGQWAAELLNSLSGVVPDIDNGSCL